MDAAPQVQNRAMEKNIKQKAVYISAYIFCLICPPLILSGSLGHGITLWRDWWIYLPLFLIGIFASFGNKKIRNLAFVFQMPITINGIFTTVFSPLLYLEHTYYVVITTGLYCAFFIIWHSYSLTIVSAWQILGTIYLGMLFIQVALMLYLGMYWNDFINSIAGSFSTDIVYSIGLLFTTLFCHIKTYILKWVILFNGLCIYIFVGGFYIDPYVFNKLQYGTFTGETKEKAVLILPETDKEKGSETNIPQGYQVCMIAHSLNPWTTKMFEGIALQFHNHPVRFFILGVTDTPTEAEVLSREHKTMHVTVPLYFISREKLKKSPLKANAYGDYICILKNDTLIYKGEADPTTRAIRFLSK